MRADPMRHPSERIDEVSRAIRAGSGAVTMAIIGAAGAHAPLT
jgi:hypothetical protein